MFRDKFGKVLIVGLIVLLAIILSFVFLDTDMLSLQDTIDASPFEKHGFEEDGF
jgi:hypothetical protein